MTPSDLATFEPQRRYATLVAVATESTATVIDEIIDLYDRIIGKIFNSAKNRHQQHFQASGKAINDTVSVDEAQTLARPGDFDFLHHISESYRDSTYVLDGLLYHESDLRIEEHYTDTNGFTDHVFGLMHLLGFRFAPRIRELGRIERTLFILDWFQGVELRRRVNAGLNKGEARNALARAVFFNRLGEFRGCGFEQQRYRASGLNLLTAAIVLWNTSTSPATTPGATTPNQA